MYLKLIALLTCIGLAPFSFGQVSFGLQFNSQKYYPYEKTSLEKDADSPRNIQLYPSAVFNYQFNAHTAIGLNLGWYSNRHEFVQSYELWSGDPSGGPNGASSGSNKLVVNHCDMRIRFLKPSLFIKSYLVENKLYATFGIGASWLADVRFFENYQESWYESHYYPPSGSGQSPVIVNNYSKNEDIETQVYMNKLVVQSSIKLGYQWQFADVWRLYGELGIGYEGNQINLLMSDDNSNSTYSNIAYDRSSRMNVAGLKMVGLNVGIVYAPLKSKD